MAENNPINYDDLFNFDDKSSIEKGINGIRQLKKEYVDFFNAVIGGQLDRLAQQEKDLIELNKQLSESTKQLSITNKKHQESLLENLQAAEQNASAQRKLKEEQESAKKAGDIAGSGVKSLTKEYRDLKVAYEQALKAGDNQKLVEVGRKAVVVDSQIKSMNNALRATKQVFTAAAGSYEELDLRTKKLVQDLHQMPGGFDGTNKAAKALKKEIYEATKQLKQFDDALSQNFRNVGNYKSALQNAGAQFSSFAASYVSIYAAFALVQKVLKSNAEIADSLADVRRTASLTAVEADNLVDSLKKIDTRTSLKGLLDIAIIGGQLGIAKDQLGGFTKAIDQLSVVLSGEISGGAEAVASALGKINGVFKVQQKEGTDVERSFNKTGSAILALGQAGLATGEFLQDFTLRVAGVAQVAKLSLPTMLAYGAVLEESGISAEVAGTALNRLIGALSTKREKFFAIARIADAKLTLKDFTNLINTDAKKALDLFFQGLNKGGSSMTAFSDLLNTIGLKAGPSKNAIIALANNTDLLTERINQSTKAYEDGTLAQEQFKIKNENLGASVDHLSKTFENATTSGGISKFFKIIIEGADLALQGLEGLINKLGKLTENFNTLSPFEKYKIKVQNLNRAEVDRLSGVGIAKADRIVANNDSEEDLKKRLAQEQSKLRDLQKRFNYNKEFAKNPDNGGDALESAIKNTKALANAAYTQKALVDRLKESYKQKYKVVKDTNKEISKETQDLTDAAIAGSKKSKKEKKPKTEFELLKLSAEQQRKDLEDTVLAGKALDPKRIEKYQNTLEKIAKITEKLKELSKTRIEIQLDKISADREDLQGKLDNKLISQKEYSERLLGLELNRLNVEQSKYQENSAEFKRLENEKFNVRKKLTEDYIKILIAENAIAQGEDTTKLNYALKPVALKDPNNPTKSERKQLEANEKLQKEYDERKYIRDLQTLDGQQSLFKEGSDEFKKIEEQKSELYRREQERRTAIAVSEEGKRRDAIKSVFQELRDFTGPLSRELGEGFTELFNSVYDNIERLVSEGELRFEEIVGFAKASFATVFDEFRNSSDARIEQFQADKDRELEIAGNNAVARANIEKIYNKKIADEKRKQAIADKAAAILSIAINTASAILKVTAQTGVAAPFIIPAIIALGAIQAGIVAARPIPKFARGTKNAPGGAAWVGEEGSELIEEGGNFRLSGSKPQLTYLKKGAKVYTAEETKRVFNYDKQIEHKFSESILDSLLAGTGVVIQSQQKNQDQLINAILNKGLTEDQVYNAVSKAWGGVTVQENNWDENGYSTAIRKKSSRVEAMNRRNRMGGEG